MNWSIRLTDANGHTAERQVKAKTRAKAWDAYVEASPVDPGALRVVELVQDGSVVDRTEWRDIGTADAYRIRQGRG